MRKKLLALFLFFQFTAFSQPISVNSTQYTVPQLVQNILFGNSSTNCLSGEITNISWRTGTNFTSSNGIGYFTNTNPNFPISSGVILSTGSANNAPGPNTSTLSNGEWPGDNDLYNYLLSIGIVTAGIDNLNDATVLEFDFQPYVNQFSFDFLFASEEYGAFQCAYADAFAFFLTDVTAGTPATNIALVPNTSIPISVVTIRDSENNSACPSQNENYFGSYNGGINAGTSATNFNGETVVMTAQSAVNPLHTYHIKLVIADRNDNQYDSAVFLAGGTFELGIGQLQGAGVYEGMTNIIQVCPNEEITIQAGTMAIPNVTYSWTKDGVPLPAITSSTLTVTQSGVYQLVLSSANCQISSSSMTIQYFDPFPINEAINLDNPSNIFDLTTNIPVILNGENPVNYDISFHTSLWDAQNLVNPIQAPGNYTGQDGEIIYVKIESTLSGCIETKSFILNAPATPINDKCVDAIPLLVGANFDDHPTTATNFAASNDDFNLACFCDGNYSARDIWYTLEVPDSGNVTIETQGNGGLNDTVLEAFSSCGSNVSIGCNNNNNPDSSRLTVSNLYSKLSLTGLTPGQSIVLRSFGKNESQGSFIISAYDSSLSNGDFTHSGVSYYPVPVIDYLTISNNDTIATVEVYNLLGSKVMSQTVNSTQILVDLSHLQSSVYLVKTIGDNNKTETFKIVKN